MSALAISEAAERYGWTFILLARASKHPWTPDGVHVYTDIEGARAYRRETGGNIGLTASNLAVLDWDIDKGRELLFEALGVLPLTVRTGKGNYHTYVAGDETLPAKIYLDGVVIGDIRRLSTEYVVSPPSIHPDTGKRYEALVESISLEPLPDHWRWYLDNARPAHDRPGQPFEVPESISEGDRHRTFFRWARSWKAQGFSLEETLELLRLANANITDPPLDERELERYVARCYRQPDAPRFREGVSYGI